MKVRDKHKDEIYFDNFINKRSEILSQSELKLKNKLIKPDRVYSVMNNNFKKYLSLIKAKYSRGDDMFTNDIYNDFRKSFEALYKGWEKNRRHISITENDETLFLNQYGEESYRHILELISTAVLIDASYEDFELLQEFIDRDNVNDLLYEFLLKSKIEKRKDIVTESYSHFFGINQKYGRLKSIIKQTDNSLAEKELKFYLDNEWYKNLKDTPLYNEHLNKHNIYSGYWCFVAAAIVKIKVLDDRTFRDNQYYPRDMLVYDQ
jgi:hypothetical protein